MSITWARSLIRRSFSSGSAMVVDDPYHGRQYCRVPYVSSKEAETLVLNAHNAQQIWKDAPVESRISLVQRFLIEMKKKSLEIGTDISGMMGKPLKYAQGEINGVIERSEAMIKLAPTALADEILPQKAGFVSKIAREPVGVVVVIAPWNYPLLTATNAVIPAILAGNAVLLKHSSRTPLCADHFADAFKLAGAPAGLISPLHANHSTLEHVIAQKQVGYVHFTGSVSGGHQVYNTVARRFIDVGLELGGKDPAYIREDANLEYAAEQIVDGAFFNAGQSCCGVERVYVHHTQYSKFLEIALSHVKAYNLGDPMLASTTMGPLAQPSAVDFLERQVKDAVNKGARLLCGGKPTTVNQLGRFFQPALLADCNHTMDIMMEESFGPVLGVQSVSSDEEAISLMNDSPYGLTCSLWTADAKRAESIGRSLQTGTVFLNRCDYLDPFLAWTGVKDTGKGASLSSHGFDPVTRLKSYHFKV